MFVERGTEQRGCLRIQSIERLIQQPEDGGLQQQARKAQPTALPSGQEFDCAILDFCHIERIKRGRDISLPPGNRRPEGQILGAAFQNF